MIKVGDSFKFDDGSSIHIIQIKNAEYQGENTQMVTYTTSGPMDLPRKLVMEINFFISNFGHLFTDNNTKNENK